MFSFFKCLWNSWCHFVACDEVDMLFTYPLPLCLSVSFSLSLQDEEAVKKLTASSGTKSRLAKPVQELIRMIFDVESMKKAMVEFEVSDSSNSSDSRVTPEKYNFIFITSLTD